MNRNGEKQAGKLSSLDPKARGKGSWQKILKGQYLLRPNLTVWVINAITAVAVMLIITHPGGKEVKKVYNPPVRPGDPVIAVRNFKVPQDIEVIDLEGTRKRMEEAEKRTKSVYDWDPLVQESIRKDVSAFFAGFRDLYPPEKGPGGESEPITVPSAFLPEKEQQLLRSFGAPLSAEDLEILKGKRFSPDLEAGVNRLIAQVYTKDDGGSQFVVPSKELLLKEKEKGIIAHRLDAGPEAAPLEIKDLDSVLDINSAQRIIEESASGVLPGLEPEVRDVLVRTAKNLLEPNLTFNKKKTEENKAEHVASVKPLYNKFKKDEVLARKGDRLPPDTREKLDAVIAALETSSPRSFRSLGLLAMVLFLVATIMSFARRNIKKFRLEPKDMVFLSAVLVLSLSLLRGAEVVALSVQDNLSSATEGLNYYYLIPLAGAVMLVRMVLNSEIALVFAIVLSLLGGIVADNSLTFGIYTMVGSVVAAGEVRQCRQRSTILRAGLVLGAANVMLIIIISIISDSFLDLDSYLPKSGLLYNSLFGLAGGVFAAVVVTGLVPVAESLFSYATDIKLLELLNQDRELLKKLSMQAPGTHQHSLMVGNLAEKAAEKIGANPLLARVCAMYHDLGKMNKPAYFAENQWEGVNVHERLSPSMSTLVIHNHVKDGVEMAVRDKLPGIVIDCIRQHHGTSLLSFFYEKAKELDSSGVPVEENEYRYPGPKPQSREAAIIMLADVVESAARTVRDPNPARMRGMVQKLINRFFTDGQLDECDLTLKDLHEIARSFNTTLGAIYHHRPDYPMSAVKGAEAEKKKKAEQNAAGPKDNGQHKDKNGQEKDKKDREDYLKRLGMS